MLVLNVVQGREVELDAGIVSAIFKAGFVRHVLFFYYIDSLLGILEMRLLSRQGHRLRQHLVVVRETGWLAPQGTPPLVNLHLLAH